MAHSNDPYRWVILALAWLVYFSFGLILSSIPPLATTINSDLSLTLSQMGVVLGSVILMYIPLAIPTGVLIDRIGQRKMITAGLILISLSAVLRSFAINFETLFLTVLIFGFGGPTISVGLAKVVASTFIDRERGLASGIYMTGAIIGSAMALALTNAIIVPLVGTWRNAFSFYGLLGFLIAVAWVLFAKAPKSIIEERQELPPLSKMVRNLLGLKNVWLVAIIGSSGFLVFYGFGNWLPALLESKGYSVIDAGLIASFPTWIGLITSAIIPGLTKTGSRRPVIISILLIQGISIVLVGVTAGPFLLASLAVYGLISGAMMPVLLVVLMDLPNIGAEYTGVASGIYFSIGAFCGFIGPSIVGYLTDLTGTFLPAIILLALVMEAMIALTLLLKEN
ncbi:MAG: MFS transporter [Candidatus Thorarchaeota archaeon]